MPNPDRSVFSRRVTPEEKIALEAALEAFRAVGGASGEAASAPSGVQGGPASGEDLDELVIDTMTGEKVPRRALIAEPGPAPEPEEGKKARKTPDWAKDWERYAEILSRLPLNSHAHHREEVLRFLMLNRPEDRETESDRFSLHLYERETDGLSLEERGLLRRMTCRLAAGFYFNLIHHGDGLSPFESSTATVVSSGG